MCDLQADFFCVRAGTGILTPKPRLTPNPLSKFGEGADGSPSPHLGKGSGDGETGIFTPIESLKAGDLVFTHNNRFMLIEGVMSREYEGEMLCVELTGAEAQLFITPNHPVACVLADLPEYEARVATSRFLRSNATKAESHLWTLIRGRSTGVKFRRQQRLGSFIVDFYAPEIRLAVEVDGGYHELYEQKEYDAIHPPLLQT